MKITPDSYILWHWGFIKLNLTIVTTWGVMGLLTIVSYLITRKIPTQKGSRYETSLEILVEFICQQLSDAGLRDPRRYLDFIGTLFIFILSSGLLSIIPEYIPPTSSLSTTAALAICVFTAVPLYAMREKGFFGFLKNYIHPSVFMLPFNIIGDITRTLALAIRLFGNMMSGAVIVVIIFALSPLFFPIFLTLLGLVTSCVQAYIFTVLATVYIAAATRTLKKEA